jgi:spore germination protein GerM
MFRTPITLAASAAFIFFASTPDFAAARTGDVVTITNPAAQDAADLRAQIEAPGSPFPEGTRLLSLTVADGTAVADFSTALTARFPGGDSREIAIVNAITRTLGHDPRVSQVRVFQDGHPIDSIGGMIDLSQPLPVPHDAQFLHRRGTHRR